MGAITGSPDDILVRVEKLVKQHIPDAVCELQLYKTQIGCGALDERGHLHEVKWSLRKVSEYLVESQSRAVASHFVSRRLL